MYKSFSGLEGHPSDELRLGGPKAGGPKTGDLQTGGPQTGGPKNGGNPDRGSKDWGFQCWGVQTRVPHLNDFQGLHKACNKNFEAFRFYSYGLIGL